MYSKEDFSIEINFCKNKIINKHSTLDLLNKALREFIDEKNWTNSTEIKLSVILFGKT